MHLKFKDQYKEWLDKNGGLKPSTEASAALYRNKPGKKGFELESLENARFRPGCLYALNYLSMNEITSIRTGGGAPYYDSTPLVLALGIDKEFLTAINLNVLPMPTRILMFGLLFQLYGSQIEACMGKKHSEWPAFPKFSAEVFVKLLRLKSRIAINKYKREDIQTSNAIMWESAMQTVTLYLDKTIIYNKSKALNREIVMRASLVT